MDQQIKILSLYVAIASVFQVTETLIIPPLIPGFKIGFANIVTLLVLYKFSFKDALIVGVLRVFTSSLVLGTFLSPAFFISLMGTLISCLAMGSVFCVKFFRLRLTVVGVSVVGGVFHNIGQLVTSYYFFIKHSSIWLFLPLLIILGIISGIFIGVITDGLLKRMDSNEETDSACI